MRNFHNSLGLLASCIISKGTQWKKNLIFIAEKFAVINCEKDANISIPSIINSHLDNMGKSFQSDTALPHVALVKFVHN